jgi:hypothetical protein
MASLRPATFEVAASQYSTAVQQAPHLALCHRARHKERLGTACRPNFGADWHGPRLVVGGVREVAGVDARSNQRDEGAEGEGGRADDQQRRAEMFAEFGGQRADDRR